MKREKLIDLVTFGSNILLNMHKMAKDGYLIINGPILDENDESSNLYKYKLKKNANIEEEINYFTNICRAIICNYLNEYIDPFWMNEYEKVYGMDLDKKNLLCVCTNRINGGFMYPTAEILRGKRLHDLIFLDAPDIIVENEVREFAKAFYLNRNTEDKELIKELDEKGMNYWEELI